MGSSPNPWPELVAAARDQIKRANKGDKLAAQDVLRQAAVGLRDVLSGKLPDPERLEYLRFLLAALEQIAQDVPADKALGLWTNSRPKSVSDDRGVSLYLAVGIQLGKAAKRPSDKPVADAIAVVARRYKVGKPTVTKAWKKFGGKLEWAKAYKPESSGK